jgi:hypothetical protein
LEETWLNSHSDQEFLKFKEIKLKHTSLKLANLSLVNSRDPTTL